MYKTPTTPATCNAECLTEPLSTFQLLLPPPPSTMAGQLVHGGGGLHHGGHTEDMMSSPTGSEGDYCHDSKRKRKSCEMNDSQS